MTHVHHCASVISKYKTSGLARILGREVADPLELQDTSLGLCIDGGPVTDRSVGDESTLITSPLSPGYQCSLTHTTTEHTLSRNESREKSREKSRESILEDTFTIVYINALGDQQTLYTTLSQVGLVVEELVKQSLQVTITRTHTPVKV